MKTAVCTLPGTGSLHFDLFPQPGFYRSNVCNPQKTPHGSQLERMEKFQKFVLAPEFMLCFTAFFYQSQKNQQMQNNVQ